MPYLLLDKAFLKYLYYGDQPQHVALLQPAPYDLTLETKPNRGGGGVTILYIGYPILIDLQCQGTFDPLTGYAQSAGV